MPFTASSVNILSVPKMRKYPVERISRKAFDSLPEYSISMPTLTTIGKVWKRDLNFHPTDHDWLICEYVDIGKTGVVGVDYRRPEIIG